MTFVTTLIRPVCAAFPLPWQLSFQKPASTMMEGIIDLHHDIFTFLIIIIIFVSFMLGTILWRYTERCGFPFQQTFVQFYTGHGITHNTVLETVWTIIPTLILLLIATPSFALIYALDEVVEPQITIRVVGRQWYWTYEYPDTVELRVPVVAHSQAIGLQRGAAVTQQIFASIQRRQNLTAQGLVGDAVTQRLLVGTPMAVTPFLVNYFRFVLELPLEMPTRRWILSQCCDLLQQSCLGSSLSRLQSAAVTRINFFEQWISYLALRSPSVWRVDALRLCIPGFSLNSYLVPTEDLLPGSFRLLEVNRRIVLPFNTNVRFLFTSYDVIHSWAVPAFGIKVDCLPGRLNEYFLNVNYRGLFYGQCSEICGVNHGFMPIKVEVTTAEHFRWWFAATSFGENPSRRFRSLWRLLPEHELLCTITRGGRFH